MNISSVLTKKELNAFIDLPFTFYKDDTNWVAPLRSEARGQFDPIKNTLLDH